MAFYKPTKSSYVSEWGCPNNKIQIKVVTTPYLNINVYVLTINIWYFWEKSQICFLDDNHFFLYKIYNKKAITKKIGCPNYRPQNPIFFDYLIGFFEKILTKRKFKNIRKVVLKFYYFTIILQLFYAKWNDIRVYIYDTKSLQDEF